MELPFIDIHTHRSPEPPDEAVVYPSFGLHPWKVSSEEGTQSPALSLLRTLLSENRIAAIGETGLDRLHPDTFSQQIECFEQHILLSEQYQKPLIIHNVKANSDLLQIHKRHHPRQAWIIHGFNGSDVEVRQLTDRGIFLSVGDSLFYANRKIHQSIKSIPLDYLFFETDTSSKPIQEVYQMASDCLNLPLETLKEHIFANFARLNLNPWKTGNNALDCSSATMVLKNWDEAMSW